ncbi:hypothetical protein WMF45_50955 [Sorangium sp. So ce448]|uniref:hypothetical protein n=1 Tax=Sorangium sp. So ce448 TaxID=3133314 RepID=UPI003F604F64
MMIQHVYLHARFELVLSVSGLIDVAEVIRHARAARRRSERAPQRDTAPELRRNHHSAGPRPRASDALRAEVIDPESGRRCV